jgi:hypothetical protein
MIKAGQQRRFEMESTQEEKLNSVDVSLFPLTEQIVHREDIRRSHTWTKGYPCAWSNREKGEPSGMGVSRDRLLADILACYRSR